MNLVARDLTVCEFTPPDIPSPSPSSNGGLLFLFKLQIRFENLNPGLNHTGSVIFWQGRTAVVMFLRPWFILSYRLSQLNVPSRFHSRIIRKTLIFARQIARMPHSAASRNAIPIQVSLTLVESEEPQVRSWEEGEEGEDSEHRQERDEERVWSARRYIMMSRPEAENSHRGRKRGASRASIEALEKFKVEGEDKECAICLGNIPVGSESTRLPCSHHYHGNCLLKWLKKSNLCPLCRFQFPQD